MRNYKAGRKWHKVYDPEDILPEGLIVQSNWKEAQVGDWVKADDDCIIQILRKGQMMKSMGKDKVREYVGTCTGTFPISAKMKMDTSKREDIYSFSGRKAEDRLNDRENLNKHENLFVAYLAKGVPMQKAYLKALKHP